MTLCRCTVHVILMRWNYLELDWPSNTSATCSYYLRPRREAPLIMKLPTSPWILFLHGALSASLHRLHPKNWTMIFHSVFSCHPAARPKLQFQNSTNRSIIPAPTFPVSTMMQWRWIGRSRTNRHWLPFPLNLVRVILFNWIHSKDIYENMMEIFAFVWSIHTSQNDPHFESKQWK